VVLRPATSQSGTWRLEELRSTGEGCCARIEWWIGSTSIRLPIGEPSLRPSSQSALLSARCLRGLSHYYAGLDRSLNARPHIGAGKSSFPPPARSDRGCATGEGALRAGLCGPKELRRKDFKHQSKHADADDKPD